MALDGQGFKLIRLTDPRLTPRGLGGSLDGIMSRLLIPLLLAVLTVGGVAPGAARAAEPRGVQKKIPLLAVLVAKTFLRAVVDRDLKTAAPLCAATVDFDGHQVKGDKAVRKRLGQLLARMKVRRRLRKVAVMTLAQARRLFGPPPARLRLRGKDLVVAFGRFRRGGLVVVLAPQGDRWRIIALTD